MRIAPFLLLIAASARASVEAPWYGEAGGFRLQTAALRAAYQESVAARNRVVIPLPRLLNNMRRTAAVVKAGGKDVHVFGMKAQNDAGLSGWHVGFAVDGGEIAYYRGASALHLKKLGIGVDRHLDVELNGVAFDLQVRAAITNRMGTRVVLKPKAGGAAVEFTVGQLADAAYEAGFPVSLGGREYRLLYTEGILADDETAKKSGERFIALMFKDGKGGISAYGWPEKNLSRERELVSRPTAKGADADGEQGPEFGLRLDGEGNLELRWLAAAPKKR